MQFFSTVFFSSIIFDIIVRRVKYDETKNVEDNIYQTRFINQSSKQNEESQQMSLIGEIFMDPQLLDLVLRSSLSRLGIVHLIEMLNNSDSC